MTVHKPREFEGQRKLSEFGTLDRYMIEIAQDLATIRTNFVACLVKLDADSGDTGGDSDYAATLTPDVLKTTYELPSGIDW